MGERKLNPDGGDPTLPVGPQVVDLEAARTRGFLTWAEFTDLAERRLPWPRSSDGWPLPIRGSAKPIEAAAFYEALHEGREE